MFYHVKIACYHICLKDAFSTKELPELFSQGAIFFVEKQFKSSLRGTWKNVSENIRNVYTSNLQYRMN